MNYLRSFLEEKRRAEKAQAPTDKTDQTPFVSFGGESLARSSTNFSPAPEPKAANEPTTLPGGTPPASPDPERNRWPEQARPPMPLRRCGALICRTCHIHSPSSHKADCITPRFDSCRSRWFWLSPHGAIKCVACESPADLSLVEGWILARETGEGDDGWRIPGEILSLLHIASPPQ